MLGIQIGSINIALRIFIVERWTFGGIHWPLDPARVIPQEAITIGQNEGRRPASTKIKLSAQFFIRAYQKYNITTKGSVFETDASPRSRLMQPQHAEVLWKAMLSSIEPRSRHILMRRCKAVELPQAGRHGGVTMNITKPLRSAGIDKSSDMEVGENIHEFARGGAAFRQSESADDEMSADSLGTLLRRVSETSTREIENLIGELQTLRKKLQADSNRIQRNVAEYTELSQQVMQLTGIISESVKKLPGATGISR